VTTQASFGVKASSPQRPYLRGRPRQSMKWFTMRWWAGEQDQDPLQSYQEHLAQVSNRLPPDLLALSERGVLHDANLTLLSARGGSAVLLLVARSQGPGRTRLELHYDGVTSLETSCDPKYTLPGPSGYGDLGYDELDIDHEGLFVHRFLFSRGIEFELHFARFSFTEQPLSEDG
jgi:hypothetical protein